MNKRSKIKLRMVKTLSQYIEKVKQESLRYWPSVQCLKLEWLKAGSAYVVILTSRGQCHQLWMKPVRMLKKMNEFSHPINQFTIVNYQKRSLSVICNIFIVLNHKKYLIHHQTRLRNALLKLKPLWQERSRQNGLFLFWPQQVRSFMALSRNHLE